MTANELITVFEENELSEYLDEKKVHQFLQLTEEMTRVNEYMNLTAVKDSIEIAVKHYADSLFAAKWIPKGARIIDVGSGAGFPTFPLAIARPDLQITALDSTAKKAEYIKSTAKLLGIETISVLCSRAEQASQDKKLRDCFDVALARAVGRLNVLCEWCMPYVKKGGIFLAMKAKTAQEEIEKANHAIQELRGSLEQEETVFLKGCGEEAERHLLIIRKISDTPKIYPRNPTQILKKPL